MEKGGREYSGIATHHRLGAHSTLHYEMITWNSAQFPVSTPSEDNIKNKTF